MFKFKLISVTNEKYPSRTDQIVQVLKPNKHSLLLELISSNDLTISNIDKLELFYSDDETSYDKVNIDSFEIVGETFLKINFYVNYLEDSLTSLRLSLYLNETIYVAEVYKITTSKSKKQSLNFKVSKTPDPAMTLMPNFLLENAKQYVPTWSKAYISTVSNFSKILEPCYNTVTSFYMVLYKYLSDFYFTQKSEELYALTVSEKPLKVIDSLDNVYLDVYNLENSAKKIISTSVAKTDNLIILSYNPNEAFLETVITTDEESATVLYIKKETKSSSLTIQIRGVTNKGRVVSESILLVDSFYRPTINKYTKILSIQTSETVVIANFIDCVKEHQYTGITSIPTPLFVDKEDQFNFYTPDFRLEKTESARNTVLSIYHLNSLKYYFCFDTKVTSAYIDPYLNIHWTSEDNTYRISNLCNYLVSTTASTNDNISEYIYTDSTPYLNEWCDLIVNLPKLSEDFPDLNSVVVSLQINNEIKYLDPITEQFQSNKKVIHVKNILNALTISLKIKDFNEHLFKILLPNATFTSTVKVPAIYSTNIKNIEEGQTIIIQDNMIKLMTESQEQIYEFATHEDLTNKLYVLFVWDYAENLDYRVTLSNELITNEESTIADSLCSRVYYDGNTAVEGFCIDIKNTKTTYNMENLVFKVNTRFRTESNVTSSRSRSKVLFFTKNLFQEFNLASKDTLVHEYEFTLTENIVTGVLNVNY